ADFRIDFIDKLKNKLITIPYDSDHYAISFTIDCCDSTNGIRTQQNLNHKNLSIKEIDSHISKLEEFVVEAIDAVIPKSRPLTNRGCLRYVLPAKLSAVGNYFESINSPRYTNLNTETKLAADNTAKEIERQILRNRSQGSAFTTFTIDNPALIPRQYQNEPTYLHSYLPVVGILKSAKNKTSSGLDKIPMVVLTINIIKDLTIIFNNCLNHAYYPERWTKAKVIPIKKRDKDAANSSGYRPISLTSNISKIYEKLIKLNIMLHVNKYRIIPDNQFGFKLRHSTIHAINKFSSDINKYLLEGYLVGTTLINLEKAFESVWLNELVHILSILNFLAGLVLLISDMLRGKSFVVWNGVCTSARIYHIKEGMQQKTVTMFSSTSTIARS
ncbi:hypothetical protein M0802_015359, partial [Mischocyttarus mexicanus]